MSERGSMEAVEARVEELARELRRLGGRLLEAAAEHPDRERARELSVAARVLMTSVMAPLEGDGAVVEDVRGGAGAEPRDAVAAAADGGSALDELVAMYVSKYQRDLDEPVMIDPSLSYEECRPLHRFGYGDEAYLATAPRWHDAVPNRGKSVMRGVTSKTEVLRRMHHRYVLKRDLDSPEGELAIRVLTGCKAINGCRAINDGGFFEWRGLDHKLEPLQWRALTVAAERGADAWTQLTALVQQVERLAAAVHKLDTLFRRQSSDPSPAEGIPGALRVVEAIMKELPGR